MTAGIPRTQQKEDSTPMAPPTIAASSITIFFFSLFSFLESALWASHVQIRIEKPALSSVRIVNISDLGIFFFPFPLSAQITAVLYQRKIQPQDQDQPGKQSRQKNLCRRGNAEASGSYNFSCRIRRGSFSDQSVFSGLFMQPRRWFPLPGRRC